MVSFKNRLLASFGIIALGLLIGCDDPMPPAPREPTPIAAFVPSSGKPITASDAGAVTCLAHWDDEPVYRLAWSPDQSVIGVASSQGAYLYDSKTLLQTQFIQDPVMIGMPSLDFSPDDKLMAAGSQEDDRVWMYRVSDGQIVHELRGHTGEVETVAFSPNGKLLASGSEDSTIRLWRVSDGTCLDVLSGHVRDVLSVAFSPDGTLLASGSWDNTVRLWRVSDGKLLYIMRGHTKWVPTVHFSPDGSLLATGSWDGTVRLWRVRDGSLVRQFAAKTDQVQSVDFDPSGSLLAVSGNVDKTVRLLRVSDGSVVRELKGDTDQVVSATFSRDGSLLVVGSHDGSIRVWGIAR